MQPRAVQRQSQSTAGPLTVLAIAAAILTGTALAGWMAGFGFGKKALEGVNSLPTSHSETGESPRQISVNLRHAVPLVLEKEVLSEVAPDLKPPENRLRVNQQIAIRPVPTPEPTVTPEPEASPDPATSEAVPSSATDPNVASPTAPVPAGSVVMRVLSAQEEGGSVVLAVTLQNNSDRVVRFLYSFLNVTDDAGRAVSASAEGLPGELPPDGQSYQGAIRIPAVFLSGAGSVSVSLSDYPSQTTRLYVPNIPVP